ncbi:MAG: hypothetical protein JSV88_07105 [Candidatus Aminicenantes bacterium]|nr:MAG: hypothetical protein JSV88_07105 [Candidatus Aminicenantes bacterium]
MKTFILVIVFLILASLGFPEIVGPLPEIMKPDNIAVYENELAVVEGAEISLYSLKDLKLKRKFGQKGEGPGELQVYTNVFYNKVSVFPDYIFVVGYTKFIFFSREGKFMKERKKHFLVVQAVPTGENFVVKRVRIDNDNKTMLNCISLYNSQMQEVKELYCQKFVQQGQAPAAKLDMIMDLLNFKVYDDKVFIEKSPKGFVIEVFDLKGNRLYQIEKDYEKIKVTEAHKKETIERFKEDPRIRVGINQVGSWNELKKFFTMTFADFFPAMQSLDISNQKIYVQTSKVVDNKSEYVIMDLKGKVIKRVYLPWFENTPMMSKILGAKLHTIYDDKLYYLLENENEEEWELHVEEIK